MGETTKNPNFFLTTNKTVGFWEGDELRLLCKALRFPEDIIVSYISQSHASIDDKIAKVSTQKLRFLIQQTAFFKLTDFTFNNHDAAFNIPALLRSIELIEGRVVTFAELSSIFLAYVTYELANMTGMPAEIDTILAAFKLCGKTISPAKLRHRLKHAKTLHVRSSTVQFHEFLNLMLWALPDNFQLHPTLAPIKDRNHLGLYSVDNPESYMVPSSQRIYEDLDRQFVNDEMSYINKKVRIGSLPDGDQKKHENVVNEFDNWTSALMLDVGVSDNLVKTAKATGTVVQKEVASTSQEIRTVKAGFDHVNHISKYWLRRETATPSSANMISPRHEDSKRDDAVVNVHDLNGISATQMYEIIEAYMKERERRLKGTRDAEDVVTESPIKKYLSAKRTVIDPVVTTADIEETQKEIRGLEVEFAFMQRSQQLKEPEDDDKDKGPVEKKRSVGELIAQLYNPMPLRMESHDQQCDSKKRNIGQLNEPGVRYLLTEPSYEFRSPGGKHLTNLHNDLVGCGRFRARSVRVVNPEAPIEGGEAWEQATAEAEQQKPQSQQEHTGLQRMESVGRAKLPFIPDSSWMSVFYQRNARSASFPPVDMEQYYVRKMQEFGVQLAPETLQQTNC